MILICTEVWEAHPRPWLLVGGKCTLFMTVPPLSTPDKDLCLTGASRVYFFQIILLFLLFFFFLRFLNVDHFKHCYWICYNIASAFCCCFCCLVWFWFHGLEACGIFSSQTRGRTCTPSLERQGLNHWIAWGVPICLFLVLACKVFFLWGETPTHVLVTEAFV